jgi:hypothetical protein
MSRSEVDGIGLAEAIGQIKAELGSAQAAPMAGGIRLPVKSVTVELKVVATKSADAKAGFKVPLIDVELGGSGSLSQERTHTITVVFDGPVDEMGNSLQVDKTDDDRGV